MLGAGHRIRPESAVIFYWLLRSAVISRFVPLRVAYAGGVVLAELTWHLGRTKRRAAIENLTQVLGDEGAGEAAARRSFHNYARYLVDFVRAPKIRSDALLGKVAFDHWDEIDAAFREGKGVIFVSMHLGNWDMGGAVLSARGYPINVIAQTFAHDRLNQRVVRARQGRGLKVIPAERAATGIVRAMRRNEALAILFDTPTPEGGVSVPFFGRPAVFPAGPARIALRTGARVIPVAIMRASPRTDALVAIADLKVRIEPTGDDEADVLTLTRRILFAHERFIRAYPDQWYKFRPMWSPSGQSRQAGAEPALASPGMRGADGP